MRVPTKMHLSPGFALSTISFLKTISIERGMLPGGLYCLNDRRLHVFGVFLNTNLLEIAETRVFQFKLPFEFILAILSGANFRLSVFELLFDIICLLVANLADETTGD